MTVAQRMTADQYMARDGPRGTNLVGGEVIMPQPRQMHQNVLADLYYALRIWSDAGEGRAKKAAYERYGLPELWLVDTAASEILVFRRSTPRAAVFEVSLELAAGDTLTSPLLPGFALPVADVFATR
ncbi:MAG: Uma2 family endonuclease [Solirubrobacteraceae bacterium MAG38_C4-C5]|nr:Uma2 family endonuclease [Candidatus Siliceabacter maunaloa]